MLVHEDCFPELKQEKKYKEFQWHHLIDDNLPVLREIVAPYDPSARIFERYGMELQTGDTWENSEDGTRWTYNAELQYWSSYNTRGGNSHVRIISMNNWENRLEE